MSASNELCETKISAIFLFRIFHNCFCNGFDLLYHDGQIQNENGNINNLYKTFEAKFLSDESLFFNIQ